MHCLKSALLPLALLRREELEGSGSEELYMSVNNLLEVLGRSRSTNWRQGVRQGVLNPCFWWVFLVGLKCSRLTLMDGVARPTGGRACGRTC